MADQIRLRAGERQGMPLLADREPAYVRDEQALYVGSPAGNVKLCAAGTESQVQALEEAAAAQNVRLSELEQAVEEAAAALMLQAGRLEQLETGNGNLQETLKTQQEILTAVQSAQQSLQETAAALQSEKLSARSAAAVTPPASDADMGAVAVACAAIIAALQAAGLMQAS